MTDITPTIQVGVIEHRISENITFKVLTMAGREYVTLIINDAKDRVCMPLTMEQMVEMHSALEKLIEVK